MLRYKERKVWGVCSLPGRRKEHWVRDFVNYPYLPPDGKINSRPLGNWSVYRKEGEIYVSLGNSFIYSTNIKSPHYVP